MTTKVAEDDMPAPRRPNEPIPILIAGDTRIYAELLSEVLKRDRSVHVVGVASSSREALEIAAQTTIDVAAVSLNLDEQSERGCDVVRQLRALHPEIRVIMLLDSAKKEKVVNAFRAGAKGVFSKDAPLSRLSKCVRCVHEGQVWISHEELELVLEALATSPAISAVDTNGFSLLTERERAVVQCVAEGLTNNEIAERLKLSRHTIRNYIFRIFDKVGVSSRVELIFVFLGRSLEGQQGKIASKSVQGYLQAHRIAKDKAAAYLQCLIDEREILERKAQIGAKKTTLAASLTKEQISRAEQQCVVSPTSLTMPPADPGECNKSASVFPDFEV